MLDPKTTRRVEKFAAKAGISPEYFLSKIANEWLDEKGDYVLRRLQQMRKSTQSKPKPGKKKKPSAEIAFIKSTPVSALMPVAVNHASL
jgi:hypothetical protein